MTNLNRDISIWLSDQATFLNTLPKLVLSSSSPARRALLSRLQIPFATLSPNVDETPLPGEDIKSMVLRLAELKAKKPAHLYSQAHIIGCDQVGLLEGELLCKPLTYENAIKQLRFMSGKKITFYTAICLWNTGSANGQLALETYEVYLKNLTDTMIATYLQKEEALHCAGSLHVEGFGITLIEKLAGNDYTTLIGLPLIRLTQMLETAGFDIL
jgi:septum formation protein